MYSKVNQLYIHIYSSFFLRFLFLFFYLKIRKMILILFINKIITYIRKANNFKNISLKAFWNS